MKPHFSVIMPSYMGKYEGAAKNRPQKLLRAIDSVLMQTCPSWELIIIADGCDRTEELVMEHYGTHEKIMLLKIKKEELWSPRVRNAGIGMAHGKWIIYLDTDDYFGNNHLQMVKDGLKGVSTKWAWFNDLTWDQRQYAFVERMCDITHKDKHGTSNLVHMQELNAYWPEGTYKQDAFFASELKKTGPGEKIATPEYCVAHIPGNFDV